MKKYFACSALIIALVVPAYAKHKPTIVTVEILDTVNLTQSSDARGTNTGSVVGDIVANSTGRKTHTDTATLNVIINGEHVKLDCYEHRRGCMTLAPGKYVGELKIERDEDVTITSVWINSEVPLSHAKIKDHYVVAGSW
jgi:hypothetical protein